MKTKYKYIEFVKQESGLRPDDTWQCLNRKKVLLGHVGYIAEWSEWEFCPTPNKGFTIVCLRDIAHFLDELNKERKPK